MCGVIQHGQLAKGDDDLLDAGTRRMQLLYPLTIMVAAKAFLLRVLLPRWRGRNGNCVGRKIPWKHCRNMSWKES